MAIIDGAQFLNADGRKTKAEMMGAGLKVVKNLYRNKWYAEFAAQEVKMMESDEWRSQFVATFGEDGYAKGLTPRIANAGAAEFGGLRPTHLYCKRVK